MSVGLYMDVHVRRAVTVGLRLRGVDVLTAQEDDASRFPDPQLLDRATELGRVLFTHDDDLIKEAHTRLENGQHFSGVIYSDQIRVPIGRCVLDLELLATAGYPPDFENRIEYLPLS